MQPDSISTGDWGLDLALGGGVRIVQRLEGREPSATLLLRGGPGAGKTTLAYQLAVKIAAERRADVAYGCVELLPTELRAQAKAVFSASNVDDAQLQVPPFQARERGAVTVYAAVLSLGDADKAEGLGQSAEELVTAARDAGGAPAVLVIDSVSEGYDLSSSPRDHIDAIVKYAIREGLVLVLLEEGLVGDRSEWAYAVDIVLELDHLDRTEPNAQLERKLWVVKNRFAPSVLGPHRFSILAGRGIEVFPAPITYSTPWARDALPLPSPPDLPQQHVLSAAASWRLRQLQDELYKSHFPPFHECSVFVTSPDGEVARGTARGIGVAPDSEGADLWVDIGAVDVDVEMRFHGKGWRVGLGVPYLSSQRLVHTVLTALRQFSGSVPMPVRRVIIGDLAALDSYTGPLELVRGLMVLLGLLRRAKLPVVLFQTANVAAPRGQGGYRVGRATLPPLAEHTDAVLQLEPVLDPRYTDPDAYQMELWHRVTGDRAFGVENRTSLIALGEMIE